MLFGCFCKMVMSFHKNGAGFRQGGWDWSSPMVKYIGQINTPTRMQEKRVKKDVKSCKIFFPVSIGRACS